MIIVISNTNTNKNTMMIKSNINSINNNDQCLACTQPGRDVLSMRDAVLTVSPISVYLSPCQYYM